MNILNLAKLKDLKTDKNVIIYKLGLYGTDINFTLIGVNYSLFVLGGGGGVVCQKLIIFNLNWYLS